MITFQMVLLPFLLASTGVFALQRKLTMRVNPDCDDKCKGIPGALIHVTATSPNDTVHHIWDFFGKPTVFLALTSPDANLTINWNKFLDAQDKGESLVFTSKPEYIFAYVIDKVIEYDDAKDASAYFPSATDRLLDSDSLNWTLVDHSDTTEEAEASLQGTYPGNSEATGNILFKLSASGIQKHSNTTPHLHHSVNATETDLFFDHLPISFNHSRYAVQLAVFYTNKDSDLTQITSKTLDDEHAPGVFDVTEVLTTNKEAHRGYMQWRDVAYTSRALTKQESTEVHYSTAAEIDFDQTTFNNSVVFAYFGHHMKHSGHVQSRQFNVSFGQDDDGFYGSSHFLKWTFLTGIGRPVEDSFSLLVMLILGIGFGLSALLIVLSVGCIISRRVSTTRDSLLSTQ